MAEPTYELNPKAYAAAQEAFDSKENRYFKESDLHAAIRAYLRVCVDTMVERKLQQDAFDSLPDDYETN